MRRLRREPRLLRLVRLDTPLVLRSGKILAFTMLAVTPTLIVMYVAGLFWIPQSWQNLRLARIMMDVENLYGSTLDEYLGVLRGMHGMVAGFWAGFPMMVMTSIVAAGFVSGERASGTFDLLATKPGRRYELVASQVLVFLGYAFLVLLVVHVLNVLVVA
ncbi:MAG: hypothetical protein QI199_04590, partial [Candidatus Korarchaeota archaeon]|nr:hypothetical protein [Candidatus Korarchaeota archaeon]